MKFATKLIQQYHLTLGMLLEYRGKLKIQIFCRCGRKEAIKMQFVCVFFHIILISQGNVATCLGDGATSYQFCCKFRTLSSSAKILKIG